jgi:DNA-binding beta-propeller fold protein YncE
MNTLSKNPTVGTGRFTYEALGTWAQLPSGWRFIEVVGVATDSRGRVFVFSRNEHAVMVFDRDGRFLNAWGEGIFQRPHGITVGPDDAIYCTDDVDHTVRKFTPEGRLLMTLGTSGKGTDTGVVGIDYRTIRKSGPPFHRPTNLAVAPDGTLVITDGYGNARVHRFTPDGKLLHSWGEPGSGPGQFNVPHGVAVDREGLVYVADRENSRVQIFSPKGEFLAQWLDVHRPMEVFIDGADNVFVAEVGWRAGRFPWQTPPANPPGARLSIFDRSGKLQTHWGGSVEPTAPGDFFAPHDVWVDTHGDIYVGEVIMSAGGNQGLVSPDCHALQKFVRKN